MSTALVLTCLESAVLPRCWRQAIPLAVSPAWRTRLHQARRELATRTGVRAVLHEGWLEVSDETDREDVLDVALEQGLVAIDTAGPELVMTVPLSDGPSAALLHATSLLAASRSGYLVVEGGPSLAFYLQVFVDGDQVRMEAVAGRHLLGHRPRAPLERLRLLGFSRDDAQGPNRSRALRPGESVDLFAHLATRALLDVYGLTRGERVRLRLAEVEEDS